MVLDKFRLDGKTAVVTGVGVGSGWRLRLVAEAGADIVGVSKSLRQKGAMLRRLSRRSDALFRSHQCDFADRQAVYAFIEAVKADRP